MPTEQRGLSHKKPLIRNGGGFFFVGQSMIYLTILIYIILLIIKILINIELTKKIKDLH